MDLATAVFAAIALLAAAGRLAGRRTRRAAVLAAAGRETAAPSGPAGLPPSRRPRAWLARLGRAFPARPGEEVLRLMEVQAAAWSPHALQGLRVVSGVALAVLSLPLGGIALTLSPLLFAAGYQVPVMVLKRRHSRHLELIASDLPEVVDLMAVLCFSGVSLQMAFRHAVSACGNPCSQREMEGVLERIGMGESAAAALRDASRHPCREMRRFSRTLMRAEEFGASVADTLEELAVELRSARREKDRARAARVSVLILLPLVFMILPSFLLLTVGGMVLGYTP